MSFFAIFGGQGDDTGSASLADTLMSELRLRRHTRGMYPPIRVVSRSPPIRQPDERDQDPHSHRLE